MKSTYLIYTLAGLLLSARTSHAGETVVNPSRAVVPLSDTAFDGLDPAKMDARDVYYAQRELNSATDESGIARLLLSDWKTQYPQEKNVMLLYPNYDQVLGDEAMVVFESRLKVVVNKAAGQIDLSEVLHPNFIEKMDPSLKNTIINASEALTAKKDFANMKNFQQCNPPPEKPNDTSNRLINLPYAEKNVSKNANPTAPWCSTKNSVCIESCYIYDGRINEGIKMYNRYLVGAGEAVSAIGADSIVEEIVGNIPKVRKDFGQATQSQILFFTDSNEVGVKNPAALTNIHSPSHGGLVESTFYANQILKSAKTLTFLQENPANPNQSILTVTFTAVLRAHTWEEHKWKFNVASALMGKLAQNTRLCVITDGFPRFTQCLASRIADSL